MDIFSGTTITSPCFIQALGFISLVFAIAAFASHDDRRFKLLMIIDCAFLIPHFYLLGAYVAAYTIMIVELRNITSLFKKGQILAPLFIAAFITMGVFKCETWVDVLPIIGPVLGTLGLFYFKKIPMRLCFLIANICWITHNYIVWSIGPLFAELSLFLTNIYTILTMAGIIKPFPLSKILKKGES